MTTTARYALHTLCVLSCVMVFPLGSSAQESPARANVVTAAGELYRAGALHRLVLGRHYRELWTTPIQVEVLDLSTFAGNMASLSPSCQCVSHTEHSFSHSSSCCRCASVTRDFRVPGVQ